MKSVPKVYKNGARQLLDKIKENPDVLNWNQKGELLYENKPILGSHLVDSINDMLRHRKGFESVGWSVFATIHALYRKILCAAPIGKVLFESLKQE